MTILLTLFNIVLAYNYFLTVQLVDDASIALENCKRSVAMNPPGRTEGRVHVQKPLFFLPLVRYIPGCVVKRSVAGVVAGVGAVGEGGKNLRSVSI